MPQIKYSSGHLYIETDQFISGVIPNSVAYYWGIKAHEIPRLAAQCITAYSLAEYCEFLKTWNSVKPDYCLTVFNKIARFLLLPSRERCPPVKVRAFVWAVGGGAEAATYPHPRTTRPWLWVLLKQTKNKVVESTWEIGSLCIIDGNVK